MILSDLDNIVYNKFANGEITLAEYIKYQNRDKIMKYEQKYKQALERARKVYIPIENNILDDIFPELAESEDEKIQKDIISYLKNEKIVKKYISDIEIDKWIAWLEKQDNKKQVEHLELKAGHWYMCHRPYCCRADNLTVKEGEKFQCEKDGVVKGFVIKEPEKYFMEISIPDSIEDDLNDEVRRISTIQVLEYAKSLDAYNQYGKEDIDKNIVWLEKQGKQIDPDKVIEWLKSKVYDDSKYGMEMIEQFKKDFEI